MGFKPHVVLSCGTFYAGTPDPGRLMATFSLIYLIHNLVYKCYEYRVVYGEPIHSCQCIVRFFLDADLFLHF